MGIQWYVMEDDVVECEMLSKRFRYRSDCRKLYWIACRA
jgi:hypothetical protein